MGRDDAETVMLNRTAGELIEGWLALHAVDWLSIKPHQRRRLLNRLQNCADNIAKAHERAATVIAEATASK
jgi:hypothetical protein